MEEKPPLEMVVEDAIALGYEVIVLIVDDEEENQMWCANTGLYIPDIDPNHGYDLNWIARLEREEALEILGVDIEAKKVAYDEAFQKAIEKVHGGPISSIEEIEAEEYSLKREAEIPAHDTWYDPSNPNAVVDADSACYCGWLGIDPPCKEYAPPGCSCFSGGDLE